MIKPLKKLLIILGSITYTNMNAAARMALIIKTVILTMVPVAMFAGAAGFVLTLFFLAAYGVGVGLQVKSEMVMNIVISASLGVNAVFIVWMFFKREYRYYWLNVVKINKNTMQGKPWVKVIYLFKNKSCQEYIMPVDNGTVSFKQATHDVPRESLYQDLKGGWRTVVIEEDQYQAKKFHVKENNISADAIARLVLKIKDWAEIKANRNKKIEFYLLVGCLIASVCIIGYLYYMNENFRAVVNQQCIDVLNRFIAASKPEGAGVNLG